MSVPAQERNGEEISFDRLTLDDPGTENFTAKDEDKEVSGKQEDAVPVTAQVEEFQEGGLRGWLTVLGAFMVQFCGFGYTSSFGVYQAFYTQKYITNETPSTISWIGSFNTFLVIGFGVVSGRLYDKGYFYYQTIGGSLLYSFSLFMLSLAKPDNFYQVFLTQGLGMGLGAGLVYIPSVAVMSHYFDKNRALAMTIVASGSSLGSIIHPIMLNNTMFGSLGFANSVRASAGLVSGMLLIACCLMHPRLPPPKQSLGFVPAIKKFSRDPAYVFGTMGLFFFVVGYYFPFFYIQLDATQHGLNSTFSFYSLVILNAASFVGRLSPGFVARRFGVPNMICVATFCCGIVIFAMTGLKSTASVVLIAIFFGYFAGIYIALMAPLMVVLSDDLSELGIRMGIAFAFCGTGSLIGTPISGALLANDYTWWKPAVFSGVLAITGSACFATMRFMLYQKSRVPRAVAGV